MVNDRREAPRLPASLHAQIETEAGRLTIAITQDLSASGLLVLSHQELGIGSRVTIHVLVDGNQYAVTGRVVRQEPLAAGEAALWRSKAAVAIDADEADLPQILARC